jgi:hypothetical protein
VPSTQRQLIGRYGGLKSWANTTDRSARTAATRKASPANLDYWLARQDPERFADATPEQRLAAAEAARRAYMAELAMRSAKARRQRAAAKSAAARVAMATSEANGRSA